MDFKVTYVLGAVALAVFLVALAFRLAPTYAHSRGLKRVRILGWLGEYVEWDLNEVVIFRRGGEIKLSSELKGLSTFLYPILFNETVVGRVSLASQSLTWKGSVSVEEAIPCNVELVVWWAVEDPKEYFFGKDSTQGRHGSEEEAARAAAEERLRNLTKARVSKAVSKADFQLSLILMLLLKRQEYRGASVEEGAPRRPAHANLERSLLAELDGLGGEVARYGLRVERVEVQSVDWAEEVQAPVLRMLLNRLKPQEAQSQAEADRILEDGRTASEVHRLRERADVLRLPVVQYEELLKQVRLLGDSNSSRDELAKLIGQLRLIIEAAGSAEPKKLEEPGESEGPPKLEIEGGEPDSE